MHFQENFVITESYQTGIQKNPTIKTLALEVAFYQLPSLLSKLDTLGTILHSSHVSEFKVYQERYSRN